MPLPYPLTAEQEAIRESFGEFARKEVLPGAAARDASGSYPADLMARLGELDGMGISVSRKFGGLGLDTGEQLLAIEEVTYADAALGSICTAHYLGLEVFLLYGDDSPDPGPPPRS
ncbi:MAG: acyl-CoA dehydrogenase family protein [Streptosporangiaceae bacterium]